MAKKNLYDHLGNNYSSIKEMCDAYGLNRTVFEARIRHGFSLEQALTKKVKKAGLDSPTVRALAKGYGVGSKLYKKRLKQGWKLEEALQGAISN